MDSQGQMHPLLVATITDIFNKFDLMISNTMGIKEFNGVLEIIGKPSVSEKEFKNAVLAKFNSLENALTLKGFKEWWRTQLIGEGGETTIWTWLEKMGYDRDLYSLRSRSFTLALHSRSLEAGENAVELRVRDAIATDIDNRVNEMVLQKDGKEEESGENYKVICLQSNNTLAFTYGIRNTSATNPIEATLDLSESENLIFSAKGPMVKKTIKPNEIEFMMHAFPAVGSFTKVVKHSAKELPAKK